MEKIIFNIEPYSFTLSAVVAGLLLTKELSNSEQDSFGNWLQLVGLVVQTYASQVSTLDTVKDDTNKTGEIAEVKEALEKLEKKIEAMEKSPNYNH